MTERLPLPAGFRLSPVPGLATLQDGRVLLGGTPARLLRLSPAGAALVRDWSDGAPVGPGRAAGLLARRLVEAAMMHPVPPGDPAPAVSSPTSSPASSCVSSATHSAVSSPAHSPAVTIVVPVYGRAAELERCLAGLGTEHPVIVVDDASPDPATTARIAAEAGARLVRRAVNGGPGAARNSGLAVAATPLVAFVDSDCVPAPGWLDPLLPHFADPAVAVVAPRIVAHEHGSVRLARFEAERSALDMGPVPSIVRPGSAVPFLPGAALVVRREAVGDGFDESMRVGEDVDLVWRLAERGLHVRYVPDGVVAHEHRTGPRSWVKQRVTYGTSAAPLAIRHPAALPALTMSGWSAVSWGLVAAGAPVAGFTVTAAATALLAEKLSSWSDRPWPLAVRMAGGGTAAAGEILAHTMIRNWWPVAVPLGLAVPRLRLPLAAAVAAPAILGYRRSGSALDPLTWMGLKLLDDLSYGLGVWLGCARERTVAPLRPRLWWWSRDGLGPDRT